MRYWIRIPVPADHDQCGDHANQQANPGLEEGQCSADQYHRATGGIIPRYGHGDVGAGEARQHQRER